MDRAYTIVPAGSGDLATVARLFETYVASLGIDLGFQGFAAELASLPGAYAAPGGALFLARQPGAGAPTGCVAMRPLAPDGVCEMKRLFVVPEARELGIGTALVDTILNAARNAGYREMRLDTLPTMTGALALYAAAGFRHIAPYYETPLAETVFLAAPLR